MTATEHAPTVPEPSVCKTCGGEGYIFVDYDDDEDVPCPDCSVCMECGAPEPSGRLCWRCHEDEARDWDIDDRIMVRRADR